MYLIGCLLIDIGGHYSHASDLGSWSRHHDARAHIHYEEVLQDANNGKKCNDGGCVSHIGKQIAGKRHLDLGVTVLGTKEKI